ncbi:ABC transporter ATP-binding protein [Glutamicibacter sp. X7]
MDSTDVALRLDSLEFGYAGRALCEPVTAVLEPGTGYGIIGSNGSGKSTLLRTMVGAQPMVAGGVYYRGEPLREADRMVRGQVAVQIDDGAFFEELTVAEHLELVARGHRVARWERAVEHELEFFALADVAEHLPAELSSGQRRRLLLASTLVRPASLLIFDEPEQRLDYQIRQRLYHRLAELRDARGVGLLVVSHDPQLIRQSLQQVLLLEGRSIRALDAESGARWLEGQVS